MGSVRYMLLKRILHVIKMSNLLRICYLIVWRMEIYSLYLSKEVKVVKVAKEEVKEEKEIKVIKETKEVKVMTMMTIYLIETRTTKNDIS